MSDDPTRREPDFPASSSPAERSVPASLPDQMDPSADDAAGTYDRAFDTDADAGVSAGDPASGEIAPSGVDAGADAWPAADSGFPPPPPPDPYADIPAALELSYSNADLGLSERAFERTIPYEDGAVRKRRMGRAKARRVGRELVETLLLAVLIFFAVKAVVQNFRVEGSSMMPSLTNNQYLLVNKAIYYRVDTHELHKFLPFIPDSNGDDHLFRAPRRGDVIVFKFPLDTSRDFIKRVIGVPNDSVAIHDGKVFINGEPLTEPYEEAAPNYEYGPKTVPPGMYFVLGDNRNNSYDSHAWHQQCTAQQVCDFVPEGNIIGQAWVTYWPFGDLGLVNNKDLKPRAP